MRAAQFYGQRDIRIVEIETPSPADNEVLVSVEWCGICGSDLHEYLTGPSVIPTTENPHPLTRGSLPVTLGHEFCGRILQAAKSPDSPLKVGQHVMVDPRLFCHSCIRCKETLTNVCKVSGFLGLSGGGGGGLSETVAVDAAMCYVLPETVPLEFAALIEPLCVAQHCVKTAAGTGSFADKSVLILGGGPIGIAIIFMLREKGVGRIFVSEPAARRREQTRELADEVLDPIKEKVGERCRELTGGNGVDGVFDCAGIQAGLKDGFDALGFGGVYLNVAGWEKLAVVDQGVVLSKELTIKGSYSYTDADFRETVDAFIAGKFRGVEKMVTSRILLEDVVTKGIEELITNKDDHVKILVTPKAKLLSSV